jgi:hypothetical protein
MPESAPEAVFAARCWTQEKGNFVQGKSDYLDQGRKEAVTWHARIANVRTSWVGVVVQDGDMEKRTEVTGVATGTLMRWR